MYLNAIHNAVPPDAFTQRQCWDRFISSKPAGKLKQRSVALLEKVLLGDSGIAKRHFALTDFERLFSLDAASLNRAFEAAAPALACAALGPALARAGVAARDLDALMVCTCTGYLCPGLSSYIAEQLDIGDRAYLQDIVGLGCGAALPTLRSAEHFLAGNPHATVACVAVEVCSAAFYLDDDPGVLISLCLFGDGASATVWSAGSSGARLEVGGFDTVHQPENRELLRFTNAGGKLRNKLHRSVPDRAAKAVRQLFDRSGLNGATTVVSHAGGRDVIEAVERTVGRAPHRYAADVLLDYGNMSSPSVLFALERALADRDRPAGPLWLTSFGAGFAAHSCTGRC